MHVDARLQIEMRLPLHPVEHAPRRVLGLSGDDEARQPADRQPRALRPGRRDLGIFGGFEPHHATLPQRPGKADQMRKSTQRHDGAMGEGHRLRETGDALLQPIEMARQEFIRIAEARIDRHGQDGAAARFAHLQAEAPCAHAAAEQKGKL